MSTTIFSGSSQFSTDLQNVITRAVSIASLPISLLNTEKTELKDQATALTGLSSKFSAVESALDKIASALNSGSYQASVSDSGTVSASLGEGVSEGSYSVDVLDIGAYATSLTSAEWEAHSGSPHTYTLSVGSETFEITPEDNSAAAVAAAINSQAGSKVRATVLNVGSSGDPDLRISLQAASLGDQTLDLKDEGTSLQTQQTTGRLAQYEVGGSGITATSASRTVEISPGLTVNLLASDPGNPVEIAVTRSTSALSSALQSFATVYNAAVDALDAQRGESDGALMGQSVLYDLRDALSDLSGYSSASSGGEILSMSQLGLELGQDGKLTFNADDLVDSAATTSFLGGIDSGGFLQAAKDALSAVTDEDAGVLPELQSLLNEEITDLTSTIDDKQAEVDALEERLNEQMAAADAAIATLEQQYSYLSGMFAAMKTNASQYE